MKKNSLFAIALTAALVILSLSAGALRAGGWGVGFNNAPRSGYYYLTPEMRGVVEDILYRRFYTSEEALARKLYQWVTENIAYRDTFGVASAQRVFESRQGKCGGQSRLFIALARDLGFNARYVLVDRDDQGRAVKHACAWVQLDGRGYLVDPAYGVFDARHQSWRISADTPGLLLLALSSPPPG